MGYGRSYGRRGGYSRPQTAGRVARPNARPGACRSCGVEIPAQAGQLYREESGAWSVVHVPREWAGSPVSGQYTGGCPDETDRMNAEGHFGSGGEARSEHARIASHAVLYAPRQAGQGADLREVSRRAGSKYAYTNTGARVTMSSRRCEDAPCCGCCD